MTEKEYAESVYNDIYCIILEYGEELSEEIVISLLSIKIAKKIIEKERDKTQLSIDWDFYDEAINHLDTL